MNYIITPEQVNKLTKPVEDFINSQVEKMKNDPELYDDMEYMDVTHALEQIEKVKVKKIKESYLVDAMSVTEAEARVVKFFEDSDIQLEYEVTGARESKILQVIDQA